MEKKYVENICCEVEKESVKEYHAMAPEIVQTSSFHFPTAEDFIACSDDEKNNYVYTRGTNPTTEILEKKLARLEGGEKCKVFSSGMGAIAATMFTLLEQGDHVIMVNTIYGEALALIKYMEKFGIERTKIDVSSTDEIALEIKKNTKMIYFESPSSQKFELLDLEKIAAMAKKQQIFTVIDSTWASPLFQHPLSYGIDLVIHSCSKYIGGHSDIVAGAVIGSERLVDNIFENGHQSLGATNSPFNSWLAIRGLRTLAVRMNHQHQAIIQVLDHLLKDHRIAKIFHPYCGTVEQKDLADKYLSGYGSLFAIDLVDEDFGKLKNFLNALEVVTIGVSWGGFESLALPAFKGNNLAAIEKRGLSPAHVRLYVGLEEPMSIVEDIQQALDTAYGK
ncbi:aminotransferase class I/II-fold pyridoxal phosphate-dependent enzyme [Enterococcus rivorum]|uniref:homocysteine desulfhydrase n=1 Tax=Enterococcus rivorum TaxID=762845 RepID=A0A1E5KYQ4_9ENTE|nr:aminotransferase class I/II-fold pyridoxal phosphate-dependent enzyme [Enterococcus rivorum]MBP2097533.1 cystathionine beta-lyase/cystathionine gamma-synthase [Enterococcus rivorum]OEH82987.1 cystathionine gamma-synthase [Enterococcus rivorum]